MPGAEIGNGLPDDGEGEIEFTIFAGPMLSGEKLLAKHRITPAEEDEVEFVSPSVPGRRARMIQPADENESA